MRGSSTAPWRSPTKNLRTLCRWRDERGALPIELSRLALPPSTGTRTRVVPFREAAPVMNRRPLCQAAEQSKLIQREAEGIGGAISTRTTRTLNTGTLGRPHLGPRFFTLTSDMAEEAAKPHRQKVYVLSREPSPVELLNPWLLAPKSCSYGWRYMVQFSWSRRSHSGAPSFVSARLSASSGQSRCSL